MQTSITDTEYPRFTGLTIGKVSGTHPEANTVDIVLLDGTVLKAVQMMSAYASSSCGVTVLPIPKYDNDQNLLDRDSPLLSARQAETDVFVIVGFLGNSVIRPIALGFLYPEETEMLCGRTGQTGADDQDGNVNGSQYLFKHQSNVYHRIGADGQIEISHPSGLLIKIGSDITRTEINNWDKNIKPFKHLDPVSGQESPAPYVHLEHPSGTKLTIDPEGNVNVDIVGDLTHNVDGNVTETIGGNVNKTVQGNIIETVYGNETKMVTGDWQRTSVSFIKDVAPSVQHNGS